MFPGFPGHSHPPEGRSLELRGGHVAEPDSLSPALLTPSHLRGGRRGMVATAEWGWAVEGLGGSGHDGMETAELHLSEALYRIRTMGLVLSDRLLICWCWREP